MILVFALLLTPEPALVTRQAFPPSWAAAAQVERCDRHRAWLRERRRLCGYDGGRWDEWIAQTEGALALWAVLAAAEPELNEATMRQRLEAYRQLAGDWRYLKRWAPPEFPEPTAEVLPWHQLAGANP